jgi:murein DD-endopeptidase MepM/ murein hydrolase activator NlpD
VGSGPLAARGEGRGPALNQDDDLYGRRDLRRRSSWAAPQEDAPAQPARPPQSLRQPPPPLRAPRAPMPEPDPRQGTPRPRPAGTAATGQLPVARTRDTGAGPTGTAQIPVVGRTPTGPAAPRPGVRRPEPQQPPQQPTRSRLRTPPPAPPRVPGAFETLRPASRPTPVQPFPQAPAAEPMPTLARPITAPFLPAPAEPAPAPEAPRRRRGRKAAVAFLAVFALAVLWGLPAFASEALAAPPVAGIDVNGDVQTLSVGTDVRMGGLTTDGASGAMPVAPAPKWLNPVQGHLGDPFGPRPEQPVPGVSLYHRGQDIVASCGEPIRAAASGTVTAATYWGTYGNWILVDHGDGVAVGYAHESRISVSVGQKVKAGQVIGLVGETGAATGCHLHLEVHLNGVAVNPVPFFTGKGVSLG